MVHGGVMNKTLDNSKGAKRCIRGWNIAGEEAAVGNQEGKHGQLWESRTAMGRAEAGGAQRVCSPREQTLQRNQKAERN